VIGLRPHIKVNHIDLKNNSPQSLRDFVSRFLTRNTAIKHYDRVGELSCDDFLLRSRRRAAHECAARKARLRDTNAIEESFDEYYGKFPCHPIQVAEFE